MSNNYENIQQTTDFANEVPLSVLYANDEFLRHQMASEQDNLNDFIKLCGILPTKNMAESDLVENIIKNALLVEFGEDLLKDAEIVDVIRDSILADSSLKEKVMIFADKHCKQKELDKTLIN
ncbi:MAG: hypothetical protein PHF25_08640 [Candidatus Margulisbacteria bacterium]|nr:hypothetical protein [Candidatus Margulisiibacteriota bacterium]